MKRNAIFLCALLACSLAAGEEAKKEEAVEKKLNPKIMAMADNTWLNLEPERTPKSRAYCGACFGDGKLYYFGGGHFSYSFNDVELYDPATNTWTQVTEPERPTEGKDNKDWGKIADEKASPTGAPYVSHTYQYTSWDPERKKFFLPYRKSGTWEFDPATAKWENIFNVFKEPRPEAPHDLGSGIMACITSAYEPALKKPVLVVTHSHQGLHTFDYENKQWVKHKPLPKGLSSGLYSTYVDEWKAHLFVKNGKKVEFFKVDLVNGTAEAVECPAGIEMCQALAYDSANKVVIATPCVNPPGRGMDGTIFTWALDVETMKWAEMKPAGPVPVGKGAGLHAPLWYDPDHNVHLFLNFVNRGPKHEGGRTETWAYRYKRVANDDEKAENE